jgi:hypothetical protein
LQHQPVQRLDAGLVVAFGGQAALTAQLDQDILAIGLILEQL